MFEVFSHGMYAWPQPTQELTICLLHQALCFVCMGQQFGANVCMLHAALGTVSVFQQFQVSKTLLYLLSLTQSMSNVQVLAQLQHMSDSVQLLFI